MAIFTVCITVVFKKFFFVAVFNRDKLDQIQEKESRKTQLNSVGQNNSHDSAIDADLQEWEIETLEFDIVSSVCLIFLGFFSSPYIYASGIIG